MEKTSLYYQQFPSDKEYHITLDGGSVVVQYGRRGNALTTLTKCENCAPEKAMKVYLQLISEKKAKGYREGENGVQYSAPVDPNQTGYSPQLLNEIDENTANHLLYDDEWLLQEKEDGRNIGVILKDGKAIASNKKGQQISIPEKIIRDIEDNFINNVTFCGELVGNVFKAWDIINFKNMLEYYPTYLHRFKLLEMMLNDKIIGNIDIRLTRTAITFHEKIALFKEMKEKNAEGVVFKRKDSLYKPGRPASGGDQLKYKFTATCSVIAGIRNEGKRSVEIWLHDGITPSSLISVGNVTIYPNQEIPKSGEILEVKYLYAYKGGSLFQPVFKEVRNDVSHEECTISQLKYKREIEEEEE
jgi:bifunctional non-homologous end joining protein LigD